MTREEVKKRIHEKKVKKALKCLRFRKLKNFLFWLMGVIVMPVILVFTMFVGLKVVPLSTYLGGAEKEYVSEDIASLSILDAILGFQDYTFDDVPYVETLLDDLMEQDLGGGIKLGSIIEIDTAKFSGHKITEIATVFSENVIKVVATLDGVIGVETLGDFGSLPIFSTWAEVSTEDYPADDTNALKEGLNANLYYMKNPEYVEDGEEKEYLPAFKLVGEGEGATYNLVDGAQDKPLYRANLAQIPILDAVDLIDESMSSLMLNDILTSLVFKDDGEGSGEGESDNLILKIFDGWSIDDLGKMSDASGLLNNITIDDLGGVEMLGAFGKLEIFNGYADVPFDDYPVVEGGIINTETYDPKLYYYVTSTSSLARAFNDDGSLVDDLGGVAPSKYYYPNLSRVGFTDALNMIDDCIGGMQVKGLLTALGNVTFEDGSLMDHVLGDGMLVSELGTIGTEANPIYLCWAMPYDPTSDICKIILDASECGYDESDATNNGINRANYDNLTLNDLSNLSIDGLGLSTFVTLDSSTENILISGINGNRQAKAKVDSDYVYEEVVPGSLTIGDFADFSADYIALSSVITSPDEMLKDILVDISGKAWDEVLVSDLNGDFNIKLNTVMPYYDTINSVDNRELYKILLQATGTSITDLTDEEIEEKAKAFSINDMNGRFDINLVALETVLGKEANSDLYEILEQIVTYETSIKIGDLGNINIDNIKLDTVLPYYEKRADETVDNRELYKILLEASGTTFDENTTEDDIASMARSFTVQKLNEFDITKVKLSTVMESTMESTDNVILKALIEKDVTLGTIGSAIDNLTLYEVFGKNCFTTNEDEKVDGTHQFKLENGAFVHIDEEVAEEIKKNGGDVYYIHKNDGIWLLVCFEFGDINQTGEDAGRPNEYTISSKTLGNLMNTNDDGNDFMTVALTKATLRQLTDAGIIKVTNSNFYTKTIADIVEDLNKQQ